MKNSLRILNESLTQAWHEIIANKLRSVLTLLGIAIGIFCIISVEAAIGSLEANIRNSLNRLGSNVVYISKMPWTEDPGTNYYKYMRRPNTSFRDFEALDGHLSQAEYVALSIYLGSKKLTYRRAIVDRSYSFAVTFYYPELNNLKLQKGRFYSQAEYRGGSNVAIIGNTIADELFGPISPIGRTIKFNGHKVRVIGVLEPSGNDIIGIANYDEAFLMGMPLARQVASVRTDFMFGVNLMAKGKEGVDNARLKDEIRGRLRGERHIKPKEEDNFSLNEVSLLGKVLDQVFSSINVAGMVIGGFALLVGLFSVANIMFVSVQERTNIIGIKKALGARNNEILLEFLIESTVFCLIGGIIGIVLVQGAAMVATNVLDFPIFLSKGNIISALLISIATGVIAGIIPAYRASRLNPVEAIRA